LAAESQEPRHIALYLHTNSSDTIYWCVIFSFVLFVLSVFSGCAGPRGPKPTTDIKGLMEKTRRQQNAMEVARLNKKIFASFTATPSYEDYVIGAGDLIQVTVFEAQELNTQARVSARGAITLPLIGTVQVAGLTTRKAEEYIESLYREKYLQNPHVSIFVKEEYGSKITLLGAVQKPGTYDYFGQMNLMDVLAMAEGLSETAGRTVQVRRKGQDGNPPQTLIIDLDQLIKEGKNKLNVPIRGGDVIYVPEAGSVYVEGAVRRPGSYPIRQEMSIQEAIVAAGGLATYANEDNIKLIRYIGEGRREVVKLSLRDIRKGRMDELKVQDRDVIFVEANWTSAFFRGLSLRLGYGLLGFGYTGYYIPYQ